VVAFIGFQRPACSPHWLDSRNTLSRTVRPFRRSVRERWFVQLAFSVMSGLIQSYM